jgi:PilZ domain
VNRRKKPRFSIQQPVVLTFLQDGVSHEVKGMTENVSAGGVLLYTDCELGKSTSVKITITMPHNVRVSCSGKITRVTRGLNGTTMAIAVTCSRRFSEHVGPS